MKISTILDHIDSGHMALPEFQRGYVWTREQVRGLFGSLYRRHPVGGLLIWATEAKTAQHRGDHALAAGVVKLLLDGQQRMTSLYGVARGKPPPFFDGNADAFTGLRFHLETEQFEFWQPVKMRDDPLWIDVSDLLKHGQVGLGMHIEALKDDPELATYVSRLSGLIGILEVDLHEEQITGEDKTLDVVVDIFNRVNSGGTKLSKGDLALAKICAEWPDARGEMKERLAGWRAAGYDFNLDWLLRSVNTILTGEAKFHFLHDREADEIRDALKRAGQQIDRCLNMIAGRLGLDHSRVFFGRFAMPVMARYIDRRGGSLNEIERDKLMFWFAQCGMWGRYSNSTESTMDADLAALENDEGGLDRLLDQLKLWHGTLSVEPGHFTGWSTGARFYPILYMLTRMGGARDWGTGLPLKANLLGTMSKLEVHHIFPKSRLYEVGQPRAQVNALANFCFLQKDTNLDISNRFPADYFREVALKHPDALASQWIPTDPALWEIDRYEDFLAARKQLLADAANAHFRELLHGDDRWLTGGAPGISFGAAPGGIADEAEQAVIDTIAEWVVELGFAPGSIGFELSNPETGEPIVNLDLAWPDGLQPGLSEPVAVLLGEPEQTITLANLAGYRCFANASSFREYAQGLLGPQRAAA